MSDVTPGGPVQPIDWEEEGQRLASQSLAAGDATGWFDQLYAAGASGTVQLPWNRLDPHPLLVDWAQARDVAGHDQRALVVGCGLGADAEYLARLGFDTTAFDISVSAIHVATERSPDTSVHYEVADLFDLPDSWRAGFDLVVEIMTVQALPRRLRATAIGNISGLVAAGGTLLVIAAVQDSDAPAGDLPPWPLRRDEIDAFAGVDLITARVELATTPAQPDQQRWRAEFHRPVTETVETPH
jgi:SAM-dependent methyltransferase